MRTTLLHIACFLTLILQLPACLQEADGLMNQTSGEEVNVSFSFLVPETADEPVTRLSVAQESNVDEILVVWFDQAGNYVHKAVGLELDVTSSVKTCRILMNDGVYDIMAFANCASWFDVIYPSGIPANTTKESFVSAMIAECTGSWTAATLPMWGMKEKVKIDKDNNNTVNGISLARAIARVDVKVDLPTSVFELEEVTVYRNYRKGRLVPKLNNAYWDNSATNALQVSLPTGSDLINNTGENFTVTGNALVREIYVFETPAGQDLSASLNDQNACLVLKGKYNGGSSGFYRVDFTKNSSSTPTYIQLLRNNIYEINITDVKRDGAESADEALNGRPAHITYDISDLNKSGMNNIAWNGQHYLMASSDSLSFWSNASSTPLRIQTSHASGWKVASSPSWVTVSPESSEYTAESQVTVTVQQNPSTTTPRDGKIILTAGELQLDVTIIQSQYEELSLTVEPASLIFYDQPTLGQIVNISTVPAALTYTLSQTGDIIYSSTIPPTSNSSTITILPANNSSGTILTGIITVSITHTDGRIVRKEIAVRQYPGSNPFQVIPDDPYEAIAYNTASMSVACSQQWYVKRSIPTGAITLAGTQPSGTNNYNFTITANNSYEDREIIVVLATSDDMYEYETAVTQKGVVPYFHFQNALMDDLYEYQFTGVSGSSENVGFELNFPWRLTETGLNTLVASTTHQVGTVYPVNDITIGKQETITFTSIDYTNRTGMPAAGSVINATAFIHNENTPFPSTVQGTIKLSREIPSVFDFISTSIAPDIDVIPRTGGKISLTAGSNDAWSVDILPNGFTSSVPKGTHYEVNTVSLAIPETKELLNSKDAMLELDISYTWNNQQVYVATWHQIPYRITGRLRGDKFGTQRLYGVKDVATLTIEGDYPDLFIRLMSESTQIAASHPVPAGTGEVFRYDIPENPESSGRDIQAQYSVDGTVWHDLTSISQFPDNYYYGRFFFAKDNAEYNGSKLMTWAEAMGLDLQFNTASYYNTWDNTSRENEGYKPTEETGCNIYSESLASAGRWRIPTSTELQNMLRLHINGDYNFGINDGDKFHCSYDGGMSRSRIYWIEDGKIKSSIDEADNKSEKVYVRCLYPFAVSGT